MQKRLFQVAGVREVRGRSKTQRKAGTGKEVGAMRIEGVEDKQRTGPEEVTSKDGDREAEEEAEEEENEKNDSQARSSATREQEIIEQHFLFRS